MNFVFKIIVLFGGLLLALNADSQVTFSATLSPATINRDDLTTIRFVLENAIDIQDIQPPSLSKFKMVSGPVQESGMTNINGTVSQYLAISFVIQATNPGSFKIPAAIATVDGKKIKSNSLELVVNNHKSAIGNIAPPVVHNLFADLKPRAFFNDYILKKGEDAKAKVNRNMHLKLEVNKATCYVGEPVVATYKLYTRLKSESKLTQNPSFNGFSVIDLQAADITGSSTETLGGREYNVYTIRKAQLYPLQDGKIALESAELENRVKFVRDGYAKNQPDIATLFDDFNNATLPAEAAIDQTVFLRSDPVNVDVKPLPVNGRPADFKGAVGNFSIQSGLEKYSLERGQAGKLVVIIAGNGNLQLLTPPVINWPRGVEAFETKTSDLLSMTSIPVSGKKIFEYPFSADKPGSYVLPPVLFYYFDPAIKHYKTLSTKELAFEVSPGLYKAAALPAPRKVISSSEPVNRKWFLVVLPILFLGGLFIYARTGRNNAGNNSSFSQAGQHLPVPQMAVANDAAYVSSAIRQHNPLAESERCLYEEECVEFYAVLMQEVKQFLAAKYSICPTEINMKRLAEKMDKAGISNDTVLSLQQLLQETEWLVYTPFERSEKMAKLYHRANELLQVINTYDVRIQ